MARQEQQRRQPAFSLGGFPAVLPEDSAAEDGAGLAERRSGPAAARQHDARPAETPEGPPDVTGVYIISVAARLLDMHPQTLRKYERIGLVRPSRTIGRLRLYSNEDIAKLRLIKYLVGELGLNLAGVDLAVALADRMLAMRRRIAAVQESRRLRDMMEQMLEDMLGILNARMPEEQEQRDAARASQRGGISA